LFLGLPLQAQKKDIKPVSMPAYPSFTEAATYFFNNYSFSATKDYHKYTFAKKPDGWHILLVDFYQTKIVEDYFLWDRKTNKFLTLYFPKAEKNSEIPDEYNTWDNRYFNAISPYYGYVGWDADVIRDYGTISNLSDTLLNALARAYTSFSFNLLGNRGFADPEKQFKLKAGLNSLSTQQLESYRRYQNMGVECYHRLYELNPHFENFVGDIFTVYSNEIMNSFLTLRYYQNEDEARRELKPGLYDPFYISLAKNYLATCDSNAILFTNGDSDTFPLLYVQEQYGFRRDVLVVNVSLLQSSHYLNHLFNKIGNSDPLHVSIDQEKYRNGSIQYAYVINKMGNEYAELRDMMKFIDSSDTATKYKYEEAYLTYFPTTNFQFSIDKNDIIKSGIVDQCDYDKIDTVMRWNIKNRHVLYQNDIVMLDILASSGQNRPIYIAFTVADEYYLELFDYLQFEGYAYKIVPVKYESEENEYGRINSDRLYNKLVKQYQYANLYDKTVFLSEGHYRMISNIKIQFARLASKLIEENKKDSAFRVLQHFEQNFPSSRIWHDYYSVLIARNYYKMEKTNLGNLLMTAISDFYIAKLEKYKSHKKSLTSADERDIKMILAVLTEMKSITDEYGQHTLTQSVHSVSKKYRKVFGY
jgi:hypothetical protein